MSQNWTPVNLIGQNMADGDARALHRDLYAAEVLTKFHNAVVTAGKHVNKTLTSGKAYKFPVFGGANGATVHRAGERIVPKQIKRTELTISLDERLYHGVFIDELDEMLADVESRGIYAEQQAIELARLKDQTILRLMIKAARSQGIMPGEMPGGGRLFDAGFRTDASALAKGIFVAATILKDKNVAPSSVTAFITPAQESLLVMAKETINRDWGGEGSYANGVIARVGGVAIEAINTLPSEDLTDDTAITAAGMDPDTVFAKYRGDYSGTAAIVSSNQTVATVTAIDLDVRFVPQRDSYGELLATSYAYGGGVYRPEGAVELNVDVPTP